jgi:nickel-dependent lactate racemase
MKKVSIAYGDSRLEINVPEYADVILPSYPAPFDNPYNEIRKSILNPVNSASLKDLVNENDRIAVSICDVTRPMPSMVVLSAILDELDHVDKNNIRIIIATGTHRATTITEINQMLGSKITGQYSIENHNCFDKDKLSYCGNTSDDIPIWLNKTWVESTFKITVGCVEPHFFAGFSGGPKMVAPGLAGQDTIYELHNAEMIGDEHSNWGIINGNIIQDSIREIVLKTGVDFSIDVTTDFDNKITSVCSGNLFDVHAIQVEKAKSISMQKVSNKFDFVITTNSGYPLDLNLYQTIKGISAASKILKEDGVILCASECRDGFPDHGKYKDLLKNGISAKGILDSIIRSDTVVQDQWQVQIQAQILLKAKVYLYSDYLTDEDILLAGFNPVKDINTTINELVATIGSQPTLCVLPEGPQTIPFTD